MARAKRAKAVHSKGAKGAKPKTKTVVAKSKNERGMEEMIGKIFPKIAYRMEFQRAPIFEGRGHSSAGFGGTFEKYLQQLGQS